MTVRLPKIKTLYPTNEQITDEYIEEVLNAAFKKVLDRRDRGAVGITKLFETVSTPNS